MAAQCACSLRGGMHFASRDPAPLLATSMLKLGWQPFSSLHSKATAPRGHGLTCRCRPGGPAAVGVRRPVVKPCPWPPAPLTLLRGPTQAYQSAECLGFGLFLFHCFLTRDPAGPECPVILGVLRDYMMCCTEEAVARSSGILMPFCVLTLPLSS